MARTKAQARLALAARAAGRTPGGEPGAPAFQFLDPTSRDKLPVAEGDPRRPPAPGGGAAGRGGTPDTSGGFGSSGLSEAHVQVVLVPAAPPAALPAALPTATTATAQERRAEGAAEEIPGRRTSKRSTAGKHSKYDLEYDLEYDDGGLGQRGKAAAASSPRGAGGSEGEVPVWPAAGTPPLRWGGRRKRGRPTDDPPGDDEPFSKKPAPATLSDLRSPQHSVGPGNLVGALRQQLRQLARIRELQHAEELGGDVQHVEVVERLRRQLQKSEHAKELVKEHAKELVKEHAEVVEGLQRQLQEAEALAKVLGAEVAGGRRFPEKQEAEPAQVEGLRQQLQESEALNQMLAARIAGLEKRNKGLVNLLADNQNGT